MHFVHFFTQKANSTIFHCTFSERARQAYFGAHLQNILMQCHRRCSDIFCDLLDQNNYSILFKTQHVHTQLVAEIEALICRLSWCKINEFITQWSTFSMHFQKMRRHEFFDRSGAHNTNPNRHIPQVTTPSVPQPCRAM